MLNYYVSSECLYQIYIVAWHREQLPSISKYDTYVHPYCSFGLWLSFSFWVLLVTCFTYIELYWCRWITLSLPGTSVMNCKQFLVERGWSVSWMEVLCQKLETYWTILMQFDIQLWVLCLIFFSFVNKTWEDCMLVFFLLHTCKCM